MSIRPVKRLIKSKPTLEGAGVHLRRAFGFGDTSLVSIHSCCSTTFGTMCPMITLQDFPGIHIAELKPLRTCWREPLSTETAWATADPSLLVMCNG